MNNPQHTAIYWARIVAGSARGLTAEQIATAAERAAAKTRAGIATSAWHEAADVTGTLATCNCMPCVIARRVKQ